MSAPCWAHDLWRWKKRARKHSGLKVTLCLVMKLLSVVKVELITNTLYSHNHMTVSSIWSVLNLNRSESWLCLLQRMARTVPCVFLGRSAWVVWQRKTWKSSSFPIYWISHAFISLRVMPPSRACAGGAAPADWSINEGCGCSSMCYI